MPERKRPLDVSLCHHTSSISCDHCLVTKIHLVNWVFTEVKVVQKESPYSSLLIFFQDPVQPVHAYILRILGRELYLAQIQHIFQSSDLLHSFRLHPESGSVHSLEQGLTAHIQMATSRHHLCSTALSVTKSSNDFKRRPITSLLSFPETFSPD